MSYQREDSTLPDACNHDTGNEKSSSESDVEKGSTAADAPPSERPATTTSPSGSKPEEFLVKFEADDPEDPHNFSSSYKAFMVIQMGLLAFVGSMGSSIISTAEDVISTDTHTSREATVLTVSLFVLGYAFGPMIWAPISEVYGRKVSMLPAVFILGLFSIGTAVSSSAASIFVTRFFGGLFGSAPISNVSAALGDLYSTKSRGVPMAILAVCVVGGPCIAPIIGAALTNDPNLGWQWSEWFQAIVTFAAVVLAFFGLQETYGPVLLKRKARRLRRETNNELYWHPHEEEKMNPTNIVTKYISRPLRMLTTEPMVTCIAAYASFVYGLLYFQLEAVPIVFAGERHWGPITSTLPFLGIFVGVLVALTVNFANQPFYAKAVARNNGKAVPEARLPPMLIGGILLTIGLFWFGWTAAPRFSWVLPVIAAGFIGAGFNIIFQQCLNFLVDTYGKTAASATAANTFLRSLLACGLPLAARPAFLRLGIGPACSILGGVSCLALPLPLIFMKYSYRLRQFSKFAPPP